ncbi:MAG: hypothetical protein UU70_C0034G0001 [Candidatus Yanofskybacteria bacterium GW2011_GWA1_41_6]|uniref:DUF11 domain-containing protein n=1 Tax=Candidatus Yanofskybacteria bacterium GW2011_GWA1_41_6 TaxID=1619020 RepID=A0A0G0WIK4_9BACT|nr:MAG: hypothetical protein UU70_C0034G0001 [Candidatus Yanofskybacteria bacterium GW2011_GWA1_41_6]
MSDLPTFTQTPLYSVPPAMPKPTSHMSRRALFWSTITAVVLGIISVLLFLYGGSSFTESGVVLTIDGPTQASVGDEIVYKVNYQNKTKTTLRNVKLSFNYPQSSAIVKDGQIVTSNGNVQVVDEPDLEPGASKDEEFHSFLVGDKGNIKVAFAKLTFDAGDLKSKFEKSAQLSTTISDVPVALTLVGPPTSVSGQAVTYILDYRNQSGDDISDLQFVLTYPDGFKVTKVSPNATAGNTVWSLPIVKKDSGSRITIQGTLTGRQGESKAVNVTLQRNINGTYVDYEKTTVTTVISTPLLNINTTVNGSANYISHGGDILLYSIKYTNASNLTFSGLNLTVKLAGSMYDLSSLDTRGGFYDSSTGTINWNSTVVPDFNSLAPRATGTVVFSVKLKQTSGSGSGNTLVHATIALETENVPDTIDINKISVVDDIITKITSQPTFSQKMYYNDASFGSSGPMPPQVGKSTTFTIHWLVTNPGNALSNTKIVGTLPQGVTWKNVVSVGSGQTQPTFNKSNSQIVWNIGTLPYGIGTGGTLAYELIFQVAINPSSTQAGAFAPVLTNATFSGVDSFTQQNIVVNSSDLNTNSTVDRPGDGTIQ